MIYRTLLASLCVVTLSMAQEAEPLLPGGSAVVLPETEPIVLPPIESAAVMEEPAAEALPSLTVVDFASDHPSDMTHGLPEMISDALVNSGLFDVYERERLATLIQEQNLQTSGMVDPSTAVSIGKLAGVTYIVTGKILNFGQEVKNFSGYGANTQTAFYRLKAELKLIETETGKVLFSKTTDAEEKQFGSSSMSVMDSTMGTKLAEKVADKLVKALLGSDRFKKPDPVAATVSVGITSDPSGADVEIDGVFFGNTGGSFSVAPGQHQIKVSLSGYDAWDKKVQVQPGTTFHVKLNKHADLNVAIDQTTESAPAAPAPVAPTAEPAP